ncbi:MAG: hypothetical protein GY945_11170 [Rhodobacteraceae bacterium]|nr:hypothetical protein [Paracoccaceae bacterium]
MRAMDIANHALDSVLGNYKSALKITVPVLLVALGIIALMSYDFWQAAFLGNQFGTRAILNDSFGTMRVIFIPLVVAITGFYWVTVAWHRFVILDEQPNGILPKLHLGRIWAYVWRLFLLSVVIGFAVVLPLAILSRIFGAGGEINIANYSQALVNGPLAVVFNVIGTAAFAYAFLRYSPFLVAAAIGAPIKAATGRESTFWAKKDIAQMAVGYALVTLVYSVVGGGLSSGIWQVDLAIILAMQWVALMFTISLLTTLYQKSAANYSDTGQMDRLKD